MKRKWITVAAMVVVVLIVAIAIIPSLIAVNKYRPEIQSRISAALGRQVTIGNLSLSLLSGSVRADNIAIADDPAFGKSPFVQARQLKVGVEIWPLLTSRQLNVTSLTLQAPDVNLIQSSNGRWNFSTLGKSTGASTNASQATAAQQRGPTPSPAAPGQPTQQQANNAPRRFRWGR